jgi:hypothetical protein
MRYLREWHTHNEVSNRTTYSQWAIQGNNIFRVRYLREWHTHNELSKRTTYSQWAIQGNNIFRVRYLREWHTHSELSKGMTYSQWAIQGNNIFRVRYLRERHTHNEVSKKNILIMSFPRKLFIKVLDNKVWLSNKLYLYNYIICSFHLERVTWLVKRLTCDFRVEPSLVNEVHNHSELCPQPETTFQCHKN